MSHRDLMAWAKGKRVEVITIEEKRRPVLWISLGILVLIYFATLKIERDTYRREMWNQRISESMELTIQLRILEARSEMLRDQALDQMFDFQEIGNLLKIKDISWPGNEGFPDSHLVEED